MSRNDTSKARREKAAELRRVQEAKERRQKLGVRATTAVVVVAGAAALFYAVTTASPTKATPGPQVIPSSLEGLGNPTTQKPIKTVADTSGIPGVVAYGPLEQSHVDGPVVYGVTPPVGGPHNALWMNCGVYTKPVPAERAVHDLEHGAVWITYRPDLAAADVSTLRSLVLKQTTVRDARGSRSRYLDLTPWSSGDLPSPIVVSAWGRQLRVDRADDPRIQRFIDAFRAKKGVTPELGSPCGGVPVGVGGRPDAT